MANPQVEDGHLKIAHELHVAIMQTPFNGLERRIIDAILLLTYYRQLKKTEMSLEDIRLMLGSADRLRPNRVEAAFNRLVMAGVVKVDVHANGKQFVGLDKDYDRWSISGKTDKMSATKVVYVTHKTINNYLGADKMSAHEELLRYVMGKFPVKYTVKTFAMEKGRAKSLLEEATLLAKHPRDGLLALKDFFDDLALEDWSKGLRFPMTYALGNFEQWYRQIPAMPREIRDEQEIINFRYKYDVKNKVWRRTRERYKEPPDPGPGKVT